MLYNAGAPSTALPGCTGTRRLAGVQPLADWWAGTPLAGDGGWPALRAVAAAAGLLELAFEEGYSDLPKPAMRQAICAVRD